MYAGDVIANIQTFLRCHPSCHSLILTNSTLISFGEFPHTSWIGAVWWKPIDTSHGPGCSESFRDDTGGKIPLLGQKTHFLSPTMWCENKGSETVAAQFCGYEWRPWSQLETTVQRLWMELIL